MAETNPLPGHPADPFLVPPTSRRVRLRRFCLLVLKAAGWTALTLAMLWSLAAVYFTDVAPGGSPRRFTAIGLAVLFAAALALLRPIWQGQVVAAALFLCVLVWFFTRTPGSDKQWTPDVARTPGITVEGDLLTVRNVRHFRYGASETDVAPRWDTRTYDLSKLRRVDYILSYWAGEAIAHAMVSFGFDDGQYLTVSIETRKEVGEEYSAVEGFFRQYELVYVFADERDLIGVRTSVRGERVYVHPLRTPPRRAREVLLDYIAHANALAEQPEFYNALTSNCATGVVRHFSSDRWKPSPWTLGLLLPGYSGRWAYDIGATDRSLPYETFRERCNVVDEARAAGLENPDFSRLIRVGLPEPALLPVGR